MNKRLAYFLVFAVSFLLGVLLTMWADKKFRKQYPIIKTEIQIDTLRDTIFVDSPIPYAVKILDTVRVPVFLAGKNDTVYVDLPREQKAYKDSTYEAWVSGVEPNLDSIKVFRQNIYTTITNTVEVPAKRKPDYIELDGKFVYYNGLGLPVTLNIGHRYGPVDIYAGGGYDFINRSVVGGVGARLQIGF